MGSKQEQSAKDSLPGAELLSRIGHDGVGFPVHHDNDNEDDDNGHGCDSQKPLCLAETARPNGNGNKERPEASHCRVLKGVR